MIAQEFLAAETVLGSQWFHSEVIQVLECDVLCITFIFHEYDNVPPQYYGIWFFSGSWILVLLTTGTLWLFEICAFWFLLASSMIHFFCTFYCSTLMHHVFSNLHVHFLLRNITFWFFEADAVLWAPSFQLDIFQVWLFWCVFQYFDSWWMWCAAPVRWNMFFMMQLITRSAHKSNILHFGMFCFWVPLCFNQELLRFFSKMMFYWFSVLHLDFRFLLDN